MDAKHRVLKQYFGHDAFRGGQEALIDALLSGRDSLGIMPTGAGNRCAIRFPHCSLTGLPSSFPL